MWRIQHSALPAGSSALSGSAPPGPGAVSHAAAALSACPWLRSRGSCWCAHPPGYPGELSGAGDWRHLFSAMGMKTGLLLIPRYAMGNVCKLTLLVLALSLHKGNIERTFVSSAAYITL